MLPWIRVFLVPPTFQSPQIAGPLDLRGRSNCGVVKSATRNTVCPSAELLGSVPQVLAHCPGTGRAWTIGPIISEFPPLADTVIGVPS